MNKSHVKCIILLASVLSASTLAQAPDATDESASDQLPGLIEEVIVTSRKREEFAREVPVAMQVLSGETIVAMAVTQLVDLEKTTPGFTYSYGGSNSYTYLRGFGSGSNIGFDQSVGKFVDNVSYGRDQEARIPLFDIERVEILKGPQVLVFGNSTTAGAINITTRKPGNEFEANGSISYDFENNEVLQQMGVTFPLTDRMSFRLAGFFQEATGGAYYNPDKHMHEQTHNNYAIRGTFRLQPVDDLEIFLRAEVDRMKDEGGHLIPIGRPLAGNPNLFAHIGYDGNRYGNFNTAPFFSEEGGALDHEVYQLDAGYNISGGVINSTTAYRESDTFTSWGAIALDDKPWVMAPQWVHYKQFSQELRFTGNIDKLDITLGGYYQRGSLESVNAQQFNLVNLGFTGLPATPIARNFILEQRDRYWSGFVDLSYPLTDRLTLDAGVRYSHNEKKGGHELFAADILTGGADPDVTLEMIRAQRNPDLDAAYAAFLGRQHDYPLGSLRVSENNWQPQVVVQYEVASENMLYSKYVKGEKVGGFDYGYTDAARLGAPGAIFGPESVWTIEAGAKGMILDGRVEYSVAIFRETFEDLQASAYTGSAFIVTNVGEARSQGVELELHVRPTDGLTLGFYGTYLDAKYIEFPGGPCSSAQNAGLAPGCDPITRTQDFAGVQTQFNSKWSGSFNIDYSMPFGSGDNELGFGLSAFARSKYDSSLNNDPRTVQDAYALLDAYVDFGPADGRWKFSIFGRNLTDEHYLVYGTATPVASTSTIGAFNRGRQAGVMLTFNY